MGSSARRYPSLGGKVAITAWTGNPVTYQRNGDFVHGHLAICPSYGAATEGLQGVPNVYRGQARRASRSRPTSRMGPTPSATDEALSLTPPAGVAELVDAAGLKPVVPSWDVGVRVPPPALSPYAVGDPPTR